MPPHILQIIFFVLTCYTKIQENVVKIISLDEASRSLKKRQLYFLKVMWEMYVLTTNRQRVKRLWKMDRTQLFWEKDCVLANERTFKEKFRMKRSSFEKLCILLPNLEKEDTNFRQAIPLQKRVAIALHALASSSEYHNTASLFGVGTSTVCTILLEFCKEVWTVLQPQYLNFLPFTRQTIEECVDGFKMIKFPQCLGAVDGCHIEIKPPAQHATDYYNYKGWHSMVLLAAVDAKYRFLYINTGSPGRCNDSSIYERSMLKEELATNPLLQEMSISVDSVNVPVVMLGDSAFRLSKYLMKPYPFNCNKSEEEKNFNVHLSQARRVVECAFGHLKARFRRVGKGLDNNIKNVNCIVKACCVLHNFLVAEHDNVLHPWLRAAREEDRRQKPRYSTNLQPIGPEPQQIRKALGHYFTFLLDDAQDEEGSGVADKGDCGIGQGDAGIESSGDEGDAGDAGDAGAVCWDVLEPIGNN